MELNWQVNKTMAEHNRHQIFEYSDNLHRWLYKISSHLGFYSDRDGERERKRERQLSLFLYWKWWLFVRQMGIETMILRYIKSTGSISKLTRLIHSYTHQMIDSTIFQPKRMLTKYFYIYILRLCCRSPRTRQNSNDI